MRLLYSLQKESGWVPEVTTCSSLENKGIKELWDIISKHHDLISESGVLDKKRREQAKKWMHESVLYGLEKSFYSKEDIVEIISKLEAEVISGKKSPFTAAQELLDTYFQNLPK